MTTLFIIDDSLLARKLVSGAAATLHPEWSVVQAANAEEALELANETVPDVAIVDFNMPGMDGLRLAILLKERFPAIRIGILTANVQDSLRRKVAEQGFLFMDKPVSAEKLEDLFTRIAG